MMLKQSNSLRLGRLNFLGLSCLLFFYIPVSTLLIMSKLEVNEAASGSILNVILILSMILYLFLLLFRIHDTGQHRTWLIAALVLPFIYWFWPGTKGQNRYAQQAMTLPLVVKLFPLGTLAWLFLAPFFMMASHG